MSVVPLESHYLLKSLGMPLLSITRNLCWTCSLCVMDVLLLSLLSMLWTAMLEVWLASDIRNEVRDAVGDLSFLAWGQVTKEPVICESSPLLIYLV